MDVWLVCGMTYGTVYHCFFEQASESVVLQHLGFLKPCQWDSEICSNWRQSKFSSHFTWFPNGPVHVIQHLWPCFLGPEKFWHRVCWSLRFVDQFKIPSKFNQNQLYHCTIPKEPKSQHPTHGIYPFCQAAIIAGPGTSHQNPALQLVSGHTLRSAQITQRLSALPNPDGAAAAHCLGQRARQWAARGEAQTSWDYMIYPLVIQRNSGKWPFMVEFHWKWWFAIVVLVYQRVSMTLYTFIYCISQCKFEIFHSGPVAHFLSPICGSFRRQTHDL